MANTYEYGNEIIIDVVFRDQSDALYDPSEVKVSVRNPSGTVTTYVYGTDPEVIKDDTGTYHMDVYGNEIGVWYYRWYTEDADKASNEEFFKVKRVRTV